VAFEKFLGQRAIRLRGRSARSVFQNRFPKARRFAQANAPWDYSLVNAFAEMFSHVGNHLLAKVGSRIEHRHNDPA
jgi:hypothetical protein